MDTTNDIHLEELKAYGTALRDMAEEKKDIACLLPFPTRSVVMAAANLRFVPTLAEAFAIVTSYWHALDELAPSTQERLAEILAQVTRHAERLDITHWGAIGSLRMGDSNTARRGSSAFDCVETLNSSQPHFEVP